MRNLIFKFSLLILVTQMSCNNNPEITDGQQTHINLIENTLKYDYMKLQAYIQLNSYQSYSKSVHNLKSNFIILKSITNKQNYTVEKKQLLFNHLDSINHFLETERVNFQKYDNLYYDHMRERIKTFINKKLSSEGTTHHEDLAYKNDVLFLEKMIIKSVLETNYDQTIHLDSFAVKLIPEKSHLKLGEKYKTNIFLVGYDTKRGNRIKVNGVENQGISKKDGHYTLEYLPKNRGEYKFMIQYDQLTNGGSMRCFTADGDFNVK